MIDVYKTKLTNNLEEDKLIINKFQELILD